MSDQPQTRRRVTVPDAAAALGITVEAIRGRIKRGKLGHVKDGGTVYVLLPIDQTRSDTTSNQPDADQITDQSRLVEVLESQIEDLRTRLDREQEANRENRRIIAGLVQRIPELEAPLEPRDEPETGAGASGGTDVSEGRVEPQMGAKKAEGTARKRWWLRWLGG